MTIFFSINNRLVIFSIILILSNLIFKINYFSCIGSNLARIRVEQGNFSAHPSLTFDTETQRMDKFMNFIRSPVKFPICETCNLFSLKRIFPSRLAYESIPLKRNKNAKKKKKKKEEREKEMKGIQRRNA